MEKGNQLTMSDSVDGGMPLMVKDNLTRVFNAGSGSSDCRLYQHELDDGEDDNFGFSPAASSTYHHRPMDPIVTTVREVVSKNVFLNQSTMVFTTTPHIRQYRHSRGQSDETVSEICETIAVAPF